MTNLKSPQLPKWLFIFPYCKERGGGSQPLLHTLLGGGEAGELKSVRKRRISTSREELQIPQPSTFKLVKAHLRTTPSNFPNRLKCCPERGALRKRVREGGRGSREMQSQTRLARRGEEGFFPFCPSSNHASPGAHSAPLTTPLTTNNNSAFCFSFITNSLHPFSFL